MLDSLRTQSVTGGVETGANKMNNTITAIAKEHLNLQTLEAGHSDELDFHEMSVWQVKAALQAAHDAGADVKTKRKAGQHGLSDDQVSISILDIELLKAAAQGKVDLNELARQELASRGLDHDGKWVGFAVR